MIKPMSKDFDDLTERNNEEEKKAVIAPSSNALKPKLINNFIDTKVSGHQEDGKANEHGRV